MKNYWDIKGLWIKKVWVSVVYAESSFLCTAAWYPFGCIYYSESHQSTIDELLGCFQLLAILSSAEMHTSEPVCFCIFASVSVGEISRSGMAGSKGKCIWHFVDTAKFSFIGAMLFCISITKLWECLFFKVLPTKYDVKVLGFCQYYRWEIVSNCSFN